MTDRDKVDDIYELFRTGMDLLDEHEDKIQNILGSRGAVDIRDQKPLKHIEKQDDYVAITVESGGGFDSVSVSKNGDRVRIVMNDKEVIARVPEDVKVDETEAKMNNGVLDIKIPRGEE